MIKNLRKTAENILLFPFAFLLLVAGVEFLILFGGTIFGPFTIYDLPKLMSSPVFHGLAILIAMLMFVPWKRIGQKLEM